MEHAARIHVRPCVLRTSGAHDQHSYCFHLNNVRLQRPSVTARSQPPSERKRKADIKAPLAASSPQHISNESVARCACLTRTRPQGSSAKIKIADHMHHMDYINGRLFYLCVSPFIVCSHPSASTNTSDAACLRWLHTSFLVLAGRLENLHTSAPPRLQLGLRDSFPSVSK